MVGKRVGAAGALMAVVAVVAACGGGTTPAPESSTVAPSSPAQPAGVRYAHLGDSFAAGSGIDPLVEDSPAMCLRSQLNFGRLVAQQRGYAGPQGFADVSCGGATTAHLSTEQYFGVAPQADVLGPSTQLVTLMIGGNDARLFADAVATCSARAAADPVGDPCRRAQGTRFDDEITGTIAPALDAAVALVAARAPRARILVVGYPQILPPRDGCYPTMRIAAGDVAYLDEIARRLNRAIAAAAAAHGAVFVDLWRVSAGHDACAPPDRRWIEPMVGARTRTTNHPNAAGQRAIADAVLAALAH